MGDSRYFCWIFKEMTVSFSNFEAIQNKTILIFYEFCRRFVQLPEILFFKIRNFDVKVFPGERTSGPLI